MKKLFLILTPICLLAACSKSKTPKQMAEEICDCSKKANGLPATDPNRRKAQTECSVLQMESWKKIENDREKALEFNEVLSKCASEQIKTSFGQ